MSRVLGRLGRLGTKLFTTPQGMLTLGGVASVGVAGQYAGLGDDKNFFEYSFNCEGSKKKADAIVDFYSTEEFLQVLGIFPFAIHFILAGVTWKEDRDNAMDVYGSMLIQFDITEKEVKTESGETVTAFFNKRERFLNYVPFSAALGLPILMWDQTQNYGFRRRRDGSLQVIHSGEKFYGPWPIKYLVMLHAQYVIWATERHINSSLFGSEDLDAVEEQRSNIPAMAFKEFVASLQKSEEEALAQAQAKHEDTAALEKNLAKLKQMQTGRVPSGLQVATKKTRLKRTSSRLEMDDPEAQAALSQALSVVSKMEGGKTAQAALQEMLKKAEVVAAK